MEEILTNKEPEKFKLSREVIRRFKKKKLFETKPHRLPLGMSDRKKEHAKTFFG